MSDENVNIFWSAFKDLARNVLIAVIPVALDRVLTLNLDPMILVSIIAVLKYIDAYLHKYGKEYGDEALVKGITRF